MENEVNAKQEDLLRLIAKVDEFLGREICKDGHAYVYADGQNTIFCGRCGDIQPLSMPNRVGFAVKQG